MSGFPWNIVVFLSDIDFIRRWIGAMFKEVDQRRTASSGLTRLCRLKKCPSHGYLSTEKLLAKRHPECEGMKENHEQSLWTKPRNPVSHIPWEHKSVESRKLLRVHHLIECTLRLADHAHTLVYWKRPESDSVSAPSYAHHSERTNLSRHGRSVSAYHWP